jgi:hypothetical protein
MFRGGFFIKSKNSYLIMLLYRRNFDAKKICIQNTLGFAELLRKILPVQIRYRIWASFIHGGLILITQDTTAENLMIENST